MVYRIQRFTHCGLAFTVEADGWLSDEQADAAIIAMQIWTMELSPAQTWAAHDALMKEREALVHELPYDLHQEPLKAIRQAQRSAMRLDGSTSSQPSGVTGTVMLEAS